MSNTVKLLLIFCLALGGIWYVAMVMPDVKPPGPPPAPGAAGGADYLPPRPSVAADLPPDAEPSRPDRPPNPNAPQFEDLDATLIRPTVQALLERWRSATQLHAVIRCQRTARPPTTQNFDRCQFEIWKQGNQLRVDIRSSYPDQPLLNLVFPGDTQGFAWVPRIGGWAPIESKTLGDFIANLDLGQPPPFSFRELDLLDLLLNGNGLGLVPDSAEEPAEAYRRTYPSNGNVTILYFQYAADLSESVEVGLTQPDNGLMGLFYNAPGQRPRRQGNANARLPREKRVVPGSELDFAIHIQSSEFDQPMDPTTFDRPLTANMQYDDFRQLARSVEKNRRKK